MNPPKREKPGTIFVVGILQSFSGLGHMFAEPLLIGSLMFSCLAIAIGFISQGLSDPMYLVVGLLLLVLSLLFFVLAIARFVLGVREIIGAINLMKGRRKGYIRAKSMAKKDVWSIIFLNGLALIIGIVCGILLDGEKIRAYFSKRNRRG